MWRIGTNSDVNVVHNMSFKEEGMGKNRGFGAEQLLRSPARLPWSTL